MKYAIILPERRYKMKKPIIGIVAKRGIVPDMWQYMEIVDNIRYVLVKNGALVVGVLPSDRKLEFKKDEEEDPNPLTKEELEDLDAIIARLDGVILEGGLVSSKYEEEIARICIEKDIPLMGICSGFNNLVRALGGRVHIDKTIFHNQFGMKIAHDIDIKEDSLLYEILKTSRVTVNSIHTCIANEDEINGYKVVARCPNDETVEAFELENKRFVMGIKWHPELMETMNPIFERFIEECRCTKHD